MFTFATVMEDGAGGVEVTTFTTDGGVCIGGGGVFCAAGEIILDGVATTLAGAEVGGAMTGLG